MRLSFHYFLGKNRCSIFARQALPFVLTLLFYGMTPSSSSAQATYDGNGTTANGSALAFTVPAGTDRLLIISVCANGVTGVDYNSVNATLAVTDNNPVIPQIASIYYITLGTGPAITSTINVVAGSGGMPPILGAASFQNIDQVNTVGNSNSDGFVNTQNPSLTIPTTVGNLVYDKIFTVAGLLPSPDAPQIQTFSGADGISDAGSSYVIASAGTTTMSHTFSMSAEPWAYSVAEFNAITVAVPTLGEWGLIILGLIMFTIGIVGVRTRKHVLAGANIEIPMSFQQLPFDRAGFMKFLLPVAFGLMAVFVIAIIGFGYQLTNADIPCSLIVMPLLAYLLHILFEGKST